MPEDKEQRIWNGIKSRAKEQLKNGLMDLQLKVQDGTIQLARVLKEEPIIA